MPPPWAAHAIGRIHGEIHGQETVNVLNFVTNTTVFDAPPPHPLLVQLAEALLECAVDTLLPAVTQDWRLVKTSATMVGSTSDNVTDTIDATAPAGSVGELGVASVSFAASLVDLKTGVAGRNGRGRIFLPPAGEAQIAASEIDAPTLELIAAFCLCVAGKFLGPSPTSDWRFAVYSRTLGQGNFSNINAAAHVVAQMSPRGTVAVIGRRKKGRGD
jgi:hypothetical protein